MLGSGGVGPSLATSRKVLAQPSIAVSDCGMCDRCGNLTIREACEFGEPYDRCSTCEQNARALWGDPNGVTKQKRAEEAGRRKFREHQERLEQQHREKRLSPLLPTKHRGCRQRALRTEIMKKAACSYTFTLGCNELDLGTEPSNTANVVTSVEDTWLERSGDRLPPRAHLNATGPQKTTGRRCPGRTGAQIWGIKGLTEQEWHDLSLRPDTYGMKRLSGKNQSRAEKALNWAQNWAKIGNRSKTGQWLTRRCITAGLTEGEGEQLIRRWHEKVPQGPGSDAYTLAEALKTFRSVWRLYDPAKDKQKAT